MPESSNAEPNPLMVPVLWGLGGLIIGGGLMFLVLNPRISASQKVSTTAYLAQRANRVKAATALPNAHPSPTHKDRLPVKVVPGETMVGPLYVPAPHPTWTLQGATANPKDTAPSEGIVTVEPDSHPVTRDVKPTIAGPQVVLDVLQVKIPTSAAEVKPSLEQYVLTLKGVCQPFTEATTEDQPEAEGLLVFVPASSVKGVLALLGTLGSIAERKEWVGPASERQDRLLKPSLSRIASLQSVRVDLLKSYRKEDLPVKQVVEDIIRTRKHLQELKVDRKTDSLAAIKVTFIQ